MCNQIVCRDCTYETPGELANLVGGPSGLVWGDHEGDMDWCLCVINVPETLNRAGLKWVQHHPSEFIVEA